MRLSHHIGGHGRIRTPAKAFTGGSGTVTAYHDAVLADAPVGYWRLAEASGASAADASGNALTGTYQASPTLGVASPISDTGDKAITLNGTTQYVSVADALALRFTSVYTLEAWVNPVDRTAGMPIIGKWTSNQGYLLRIEQTTGALNLFPDGGAVSLGATIATGVWTHVLVSITGGNATTYINGASVGTVAAGACTALANEFRIGTYATAGAPFFKGSIDEVAVYGTALSAARAAAHYAAR